MASPAEKLAEALEILHNLHRQGIVAIKSTELKRSYKERLLKGGFIKEVTKGWYIPSRPDEQIGDSTSWYSSYWDFCARFLQEKYKDNWVISAEQSMLLHAGNWTVPTQLIIKSPEGVNYNMALPFNTSVFSMNTGLPATEVTMVERGIRMYNLPASLIFCSANTYVQNAIDARTALAMIRDASEILPILLTGGHSTYAGRLAGAFRNIGRERIADEILTVMKDAGYDVREADPFDNQLTISLGTRERSPYANRIRLMWHEMRETVIKNFPPAPGIATIKDDYMQTLDDIYVTDAYHSLSIEKYRVTPELIEKVKSGEWNQDSNERDRQERNAMAARGYWQAFQQVKESIRKILAGGNAGTIVDKDHGTWYRELFGPSVAVGLLKPADLAGYRNSQVYIGGSKHVPLNVDALRDVMPVFFELLELEEDASVRAVLGHFIFVFIHPYMDGNGRMGRYLMNVMLASGGYPWTVIPVEQREQYMQALEKASVERNIQPFAQFLGKLVSNGLDGHPIASL